MRFLLAVADGAHAELTWRAVPPWEVKRLSSEGGVKLGMAV